MKSPCYNKATKTDCPKRHCGCSTDCPDWAKYEKERDEMYERQAVESKAKEIAVDIYFQRQAWLQKDNIHQRSRKRKYSK